MNPRTLIWISVIFFGTLGGFVPMLWGDSAFSFAAIIGNTLGGLFGIWVGFRLGQMF